MRRDNLVERGREMYSASLYKEDLLEVRKLVKAEDPKLAKGLSECNQQFLELKRECEHYQILKKCIAYCVKVDECAFETGRLSGRMQGCRKEKAGAGFLFCSAQFF